jgi:type II secretory ATPase GspE/PulE/Tfp pilus assembly ATPase PilB-like protein
MDRYDEKIETFSELSDKHIKAALAEAEKLNITVFEAILRLGFATEIELLGSIAEKYKTELINLYNYQIEPNAIGTVSAKIASHYHIIPIDADDEKIRIAICRPASEDFKKEIGLVLGKKVPIEFVLATSDAIAKAIRKHYGLGAATVEQMVISEDISEQAKGSHNITDEKQARDASVMKLVNQIIADAINAEATDIHIEPYEKDLRVRFRVDGILHDAGVPDSAKHFKDGITSRIKIMSGLDIAEKRLPQDGRAQVELGNNTYDLRISALPTRFGEGINIRLLPRGTVIHDFKNLGMEDYIIDAIGKLITKPYGIILVTGPTGSGKTTTLYTCMNQLNQTSRKILTIEDPVEYDMPGLTQMQVHADIGFSFACALRSMLRHDPDVMLVGEIRDLETAETAIRTALTGHLVFSTLHTNSASAAIARLTDMGIEPYLIASSIEAIIAQRLVRIICPDCKEICEISPEIKMALKGSEHIENITKSYRGRGCAKCRFTGFKGRTVITEMIIMTDAIREMTITRKHSNEIYAQAKKEGMISLFESGLNKVACGITTYQEILRVTKGAGIID